MKSGGSWKYHGLGLAHFRSGQPIRCATFEAIVHVNVKQDTGLGIPSRTMNCSWIYHVTGLAVLGLEAPIRDPKIRLRLESTASFGVMAKILNKDALKYGNDYQDHSTGLDGVRFLP